MFLPNLVKNLFSTKFKTLYISKHIKLPIEYKFLLFVSLSFFKYCITCIFIKHFVGFCVGVILLRITCDTSLGDAENGRDGRARGAWLHHYCHILAAYVTLYYLIFILHKRLEKVLFHLNIL